MRKTFYSVALGCRVNQAEKEALDYQLIKNGWQKSEDKPDVIIVNTCTVTHKADRESRQLIYQLRSKYSKSKLAITGCAATYWQKNDISYKLPVDLIVDNQNKDLIFKRINQFFGMEKTSYSFSSNNFISDKYLSSKRLLLKIQDGCHRFCSFCIVPYLRGLPKSIPEEQIIDRINFYKNNFSIKEVILTAINTEAYGHDNGKSLKSLIKAVLDKTKVERISFGSIHPWSFREDFLHFLAEIKNANRFIYFFHIPLQSGSDDILKLMKRGYTTKEYEEIVNQIKKINPNSFIATDVIVGFLGEDDHKFEETYQFLKNIPVDRFHVFRYSKREKTAAYYLEKQIKSVSEEKKKIRSQLLRKLSQQKFEAFLKKMINQEDMVLILNKKINDHYYEGLLSNQVPIIVEAKKKDVGEIKKVKIIEFKKSSLFGKIVNKRTLSSMARAFA